MNKRRADIILLLASLLWGLSWLPLKKISEHGVDGLVLVSVCYAFMALLVLPFVPRTYSIIKSHKLPLLGIFIAGGLANLCFNIALIYGDVVRVMVLFYLLPVWGVLGGRFILKEATDKWRYLGVALAVSGAFILLGGPKIFEQPPNWVDIVALLSGFFFAMNNLIFRAVEEVPITSKLSVLFLGCFVISTSLLLAGVQEFPSNMGGDTWLLLISYAGLWLFWANLGSQWAITQMPAGRSSIIIIMELIAAVFSAVLIGGETISLTLMIGGILILTATAIEIVRGTSE